jgi:hypothetical protein
VSKDTTACGTVAKLHCNMGSKKGLPTSIAANILAPTSKRGDAQGIVIGHCKQKLGIYRTLSQYFREIAACARFFTTQIGVDASFEFAWGNVILQAKVGGGPVCAGFSRIQVGGPSFMNDRHHCCNPNWSGWGDLDSHRRGATPGYHSMGTRTDSAKAKKSFGRNSFDSTPTQFNFTLGCWTRDGG